MVKAIAGIHHHPAAHQLAQFLGMKKFKFFVADNN